MPHLEQLWIVELIGLLTCAREAKHVQGKSFDLAPLKQRLPILQQEACVVWPNRT